MKYPEAAGLICIVICIRNVLEVFRTRLLLLHFSLILVLFIEQYLITLPYTNLAYIMSFTVLDAMDYSQLSSDLKEDTDRQTDCYFTGG